MPIKNKVYGDRFCDPLKTKQANAQTFSDVKVHSTGQRKPAFRRQLQNTKRYDGSLKYCNKKRKKKKKMVQIEI